MSETTRYTTRQNAFANDQKASWRDKKQNSKIKTVKCLAAVPTRRMKKQRTTTTEKRAATRRREVKELNHGKMTRKMIREMREGSSRTQAWAHYPWRKCFRGAAQERRAWFTKKAGRRVEEIDMGDYDLYNENNDVVGPGMGKAMPRPQQPVTPGVDSNHGYDTVTAPELPKRNLWAQYNRQSPIWPDEATGQ